ncbi:hypothetical protein F5Y16DRAFT_396373 [Xylariaceae sp. FL0255]|nr:hypothetical protein F5Y16DRAFT_396373 [Xylariaceae sp. FL0255]
MSKMDDNSNEIPDIGELFQMPAKILKKLQEENRLLREERQALKQRVQQALEDREAGVFEENENNSNDHFLEIKKILQDTRIMLDNARQVDEALGKEIQVVQAENRALRDKNQGLRDGSQHLRQENQVLKQAVPDMNKNMSDSTDIKQILQNTANLSGLISELREENQALKQTVLETNKNKDDNADTKQILQILQSLQKTAATLENRTERRKEKQTLQQKVQSLEDGTADDSKTNKDASNEGDKPSKVISLKLNSETLKSCLNEPTSSPYRLRKRPRRDLVDDDESDSPPVVGRRGVSESTRDMALREEEMRRAVDNLFSRRAAGRHHNLRGKTT